MSYCTKCGTLLAEDETECKTCGCLQSNDTISLEKPIPETIQQNETVQNPTNNVPHSPQNNTNESNTNNLSNGWKVFLTAITLIVPLIGPVIGLIMSLIYLSNPNLDTKSYGKALLILLIVYIGISVVCCLGFMFLSMAGMIADPGYYYNQFDVY